MRENYGDKSSGGWKRKLNKRANESLKREIRLMERIKRCYTNDLIRHKELGEGSGGEGRKELNKVNRFIVISRIDRSLELSDCVARSSS